MDQSDFNFVFWLQIVPLMSLLLLIATLNFSKPNKPIASNGWYYCAQVVMLINFLVFIFFALEVYTLVSNTERIPHDSVLIKSLPCFMAIIAIRRLSRLHGARLASERGEKA